MKKESNPEIHGLTIDMIKDSFSRHGLPALGAGAGLAGLAHLIALKKRQQELNDKKQLDKDTIVIEVPAKTASPSMGQYFWDSPLAVGSVMLGGGIGYTVVNNILKKHRQKQLDNELDSLKKQYANYLSQDMSVDSKVAKYPILDGIVFSTLDRLKDVKPEQHRKQAALDIIKKATAEYNTTPNNTTPNTLTPGSSTSPTLGTLLTSLPGVFALLAAVGTHNYYYNRQKNIDRAIEKDEADEMKSAPKYVKIVTKSPEPTSQTQPLLKGANIIPQGVVGVDVQEDSKDKDEKSSKSTSSGAKSDRELRRKNKIVSTSDIQKVDPNTLVITTDSGNIQVDALDPEALAKMEKYKENILRSFSIGFNS